MFAPDRQRAVLAEIVEQILGHESFKAAGGNVGILYVKHLTHDLDAGADVDETVGQLMLARHRGEHARTAAIGIKEDGLRHPIPV